MSHITPAEHCYMKGHTDQQGYSPLPGVTCVVCGVTIPKRDW